MPPVTLHCEDKTPVKSEEYRILVMHPDRELDVIYVEAPGDLLPRTVATWIQRQDGLPDDCVVVAAWHPRDEITDIREPEESHED